MLPGARLADYRPNHRRAIFLHGEINDDLAHQLSREIIALTAASREPVTVYIDSPGGDTNLSAALQALLRSTNQDGAKQCRILTVVTNFAGSAAADFLVSGDYAIAYPDSYVHFHGTRTLRKDFITVEGASGVASTLKASNKRSALALVKNSHRRFFFRYFSLRPSFAAHRQKHPDLKSNLDVFLDLISEKLSPWGDRVVEKVRDRQDRYQNLSNHVYGQRSFRRLIEDGPRSVGWQRKLEAEMLRIMIRYELRKNKKDDDWTFSAKGLSQLTDDFLLMIEFIDHHGDIRELLDTWKDFLITDEDKKESEGLDPKVADERRTAKLLKEVTPVRLFLGSLCHALQEEENPMTTLDAFWLGLIDEVIGEDLPTERQVIEHSPSRK